MNIQCSNEKEDVYDDEDDDDETVQCDSSYHFGG